ncbi:TetR family transcriptional regulator [Microbacterium sediminicola]|uniref:TetR family transcriptional regulator n=1 Tax=Microbacterium sediminicola TaxID=415210 RepID=A0ABN2IJ10_9MICO
MSIPRFAPRTEQLPSASQPSTPAQRQRYATLIAEAKSLLESGGDDALQMKELSRRTGVALSTIYRYFPSKQWLILAVAVHRRRELAADPSRILFHEGKASERVAGFLLENQRREHTEQSLIEAVRGAGYVASRDIRDVIEQLRDEFLQHLITDAGPFSADQLPILDLIIEVADQVSSRSSAGFLTAREARFRLLMICELLDLSPEHISEIATSAVTAR